MRLRRLQSDYEAVRRLAHLHPKIEVEGVTGNPPERYHLILTVRSLRERGEGVVVAGAHRLEVTLPQTYPRDAPLCRMLTPVFHPNIAPHAVCIGDHWSAAESLDLMIQRVGEMLAFQSYNVQSPLNGLAAQWVEANLRRLPIDKEEFFIDLTSAPPAPTVTACANCGAETESLLRCANGHELCSDCQARCDTCGGQLCLLCNDGRCPTCVGVSCANCGAEQATAYRCAAGHAICEDCAIQCDRCGRELCLSCGEYPCASCAAAPDEPTTKTGEP